MRECQYKPRRVSELARCEQEKEAHTFCLLFGTRKEERPLFHQLARRLKQRPSPPSTRGTGRGAIASHLARHALLSLSANNTIHLGSACLLPLPQRRKLCLG